MDIVSHTDKCGFTCADLVLVMFPDSLVQLPGLAKGVFPIKPLRTLFSVKFENAAKRITRYQMPLQPASCTTGHFAQGRTLKAVIVNMSLGGFCAYVAASRPRDRYGLYITKPVTTEQLNKPLPRVLITDMARLDRLARDTLHSYASINPLRETQTNVSAELDGQPASCSRKRASDGSQTGSRNRRRFGL